MHVIGTAGHVDHGKSTLVQRLTGIDPDRWAQEKERGLTIDLGFAWFTLPSGREIGMVDVPGHERFIGNMLAGAGGISICLFVVSAIDGWMPQSTEHLAIVDLLGISHGVVALTKADLADEDTLFLAQAEVEEHLGGTSLEGARIVPCSAVTGEGIEDLVTELDALVSGAPGAPDLGRPRLWVDRVFTIAGAGTVVTGTLTGGALETGDEVEIAPSGRRARVRKIQSHKREVARIEPGNRSALNLVGLDRAGAARGDAIVTAGRWRATDRVDALVRILPAEVVGDLTVSQRGAHLLYVGSAETSVRIKLLDTDVLRPGDRAVAQLRLNSALPLARGDRFVLRDSGRVLTFGGGVVLDPLPSPARRGDAARIELLHALVGAAPQEAARLLIEAEGGIALDSLLLRSGASGAPDGAVALGGLVLSEARRDELAEAIRTMLREHHDANPLEEGMPREAVRAATGLAPASFDALIAGMDDVTQRGARVGISSHRVRLDVDQQRARDELVATLDAAGLAPPAAKDLRVDPVLLRALEDGGDIVRVGEFYVSAGAAAEARSAVRARIESHGPVSVAEIRDLLGTSRKYAVPLCEWLDDSGATIRRGDLRHLGPNP